MRDAGRRDTGSEDRVLPLRAVPRRLRRQRVFSGEDPIAALHQRDSGPEPDEDLRHLDADHAAAEDHQARRAARVSTSPRGWSRRRLRRLRGSAARTARSLSPRSRSSPRAPRCHRLRTFHDTGADDARTPLDRPASLRPPGDGRVRNRRDSRSLRERSSSPSAPRLAPRGSRRRTPGDPPNSRGSSTACTPRTGIRRRPDPARSGRPSLPAPGWRVRRPHPRRRRRSRSCLRPRVLPDRPLDVGPGPGWSDATLGPMETPSAPPLRVGSRDGRWVLFATILARRG